jgi:hypothetical protein
MFLKRAEAVGTEDANAGKGGHPERAIDVEVVRIASENITDPKAKQLRMLPLRYRWLASIRQESRRCESSCVHCAMM